MKFWSEFINILVKSGRKINAITLGFTIKLELNFRPINIDAQKIDEIHLQTYGMTIARFLFQYSQEQIRFNEKIFLLADISIEVVVFGMPVLSVNNIDFKFDTKKLTKRSYITVEALSTGKKVKLINKHELLKIVLRKKSDTFVIHIAALKAPELVMSIYLL